MEFLINTLEGDTITIELSDIGPVYKDDDVIYFSGIPCALSSARAKENKS